MFQLLMVVLAILLLAVVMGAGISYVNFDAAGRQVSAQMVSVGFQSWERAYTAFRIANRTAPSQSEDLLPFLPAGGVKTPAGLVWGYGRDASGSFICLHGETMSENDLAAMKRLGDGSVRASAISGDALVYGPSCGDQGAFALGEPLAVTYRLTN